MTSHQTDGLLPHLPYLRRHARMLSGSTRSGDEYVRLCLEYLMSEPKRLEGGDARVLLYKAFHQIWDAVCLRVQRSTSEELGDHAADFERHMERLAPFQRRILLLSTVEGFVAEQIAVILSTDVDVIRSQLAAANETEQFKGQEVLIIEDDITIAEEVADVVRGMGLTVVGPARRESEAAELFETSSPSLVLADVQLEGDDSGIAAAWRILQDRTLPVVFITGFPEAVLSGESTEPAFVVAKPFAPESLRSTIGQALDVYADPEVAKQRGGYLFAHLDKIVNMDVLAKLIASGPAEDRTAASHG